MAVTAAHRLRGLRAAVVGCGPGGVCAATALALEGASVVWIDRSGTGQAGDGGVGGVQTGFGTVGRLGFFDRVHSNTKMDLVRKWFGRGPQGDPGFTLFDHVARDHPPVAEAIDRLLASAHRIPPPLCDAHEAVDPSALGWCYLGPVADVLQSVTDALLGGGYDVTTRVGTVTRVERRGRRVGDGGSSCKDGGNDSGGDVISTSAEWLVEVKGDDGGCAPRKGAVVGVDGVVLATGAVPRRPPDDLAAAATGVRDLPAEVALQAHLLAQCVEPGETVGVVGNSHTGALVVMNLLDAGAHVRVYANRPVPRLAEWESPPGQYLYSATGLKGIAAAFARRQVKLAAAGESAPLARCRSPEHLASDCRDCAVDIDAVCWAVGYDPAPLPAIYDAGGASPVDPAGVRRNAGTSELEWLGCALPTRIFALGIREPDYFEAATEPGRRSTPGFGGPPCGREGMRGEQYVGINGMIMRANHIADRLAAHGRASSASSASGEAA